MFINGVYAIFLYSIDVDQPFDMVSKGYIVEVPATILTSLYLIDLVANFVVLGPKKMWSDRCILYLELILQITYWVIMSTEWFNSETSIFSRFIKINAIFQIRNIRVIELLVELRDFKVVISTARSLTLPVFSKGFFLYILFYFFAVIGAQLFGGDIN